MIGFLPLSYILKKWKNSDYSKGDTTQSYTSGEHEGEESGCYSAARVAGILSCEVNTIKINGITIKDNGEQDRGATHRCLYLSLWC